MRNLVDVLQAKITLKSKLVVAVCVMVFPGGWHIAQAQFLKGSVPAETKLTPAQLHDRLRVTLNGPGRTSPMIANPNASQHEDSSIIVVCRSQKQNADREALEIRSALGAMGDGSVRKGSQQLTITGKQPANAQGLTISGNQPGGAPGTKQGGQQLTITGKQPANAQGLTISGNQPAANKATAPAGAAAGNSTGSAKTSGPSGNLPAVMSANTKTATGPGGSPVQGPMKTESATGNQGPGGGAAVSQLVPSCSPNISTISGFPTVVFSPTPLFNPYTIKGCGFGYQMGNVYLTGPFNAGKIKLQVQTSGGGSQKSPARASWSDTAIVVSVDPQLSGEVLQQNVTLVVEPVSGTPIQKAGNKFLPWYEDVQLGSIPQSAVKFSQQVSSGSSDRVLNPALSPGTADMLYFSPAQVPKGMTAEVFRGGTGTSFFPAATDYYDFKGLAQGFYVVGMQLHQEADPTGCASDSAGSRGSWNAQWESNGNIRVSWKEWRCHLAFMGPNDPDVWSDYALSVTVKGPRGIDPWTGKRILTPVVQRITQ